MRLVLLLLLALPAAALDFKDPRAIVAAALETHPTLARMRAEAAAARERVTPASALPNPMLMAGMQNKQIDLRDDQMMTMYMVGISQTLIRPEKRNARRDAAELEAQALEKEIDSARAEIERDVLLAWYDLAAADAQLSATAQVREMIDAVVAASRVRYEVGSGMQADVIRAQLQGSDLDHEILRLRGTRRGAATRLLSLLGLPIDTTIPRVAMPEETDDLAIAPSATPPADHPAILALEAEVARAEEEIHLVRLDLRPDLDLEAQYGHRAVERDMFSVTARIELPLRAKQLVEPRVREAILRRDAAKNRIDELRRELTMAMAEAAVAREEATNQMKFHHEVLVPQAQLAFESTLAAYQTGNAPFDAILTTETDYLRLRMQYFDFLAAHAQAVVTYEALRKGARGGA
ncbi:MAG TPA: TolC family protein [Thermoanaerobaculia bacterium]|jgi:outer membrane protein TolC